MMQRDTPDSNRAGTRRMIGDDEMSKAKAFVEEYGGLEFSFAGYYKYSFTFTNEELGVSFSVGGSSSDIYRANIESTMTMWKAIDEAGSGYGWLHGGRRVGGEGFDLDSDEAWEAVKVFRNAAKAAER